MAEDGPVMELAAHWYPNEVSRDRAAVMFVEFNLSGHPEPDGPSFAEIAWTRGVTQAMSILPSYASPETRRHARRLLRPWPERRAGWTRSVRIL